MEYFYIAKNENSIEYGFREHSITAKYKMNLAIILPVYNEEKTLTASIHKLKNYLDTNKIPYSVIYIASNASTDRTDEIAQRLETEYASIKLYQIPKKGRGFALRTVISETDHDLYLYMDIDLSTDLRIIPDFLTAAKTNDIISGTRIAKGSSHKRSLSREILSLSYIGLIKVLFLTSKTDFQCGFKLYTHKVKEILPLIEDDNWFFDTELILIAERLGYRVTEIPVHWVETREEWLDARPSKVKILKTIKEYLSRSLRLRLRFFFSRELKRE
jgi:glycosyltransferase involved in cell wall biosynthesis